MVAATRVVGGTEAIWRFVHAALGIPASSTMKAIGLERDGRLVAGVIYENWNGSNVWMHAAIEPGKQFSRRFVRYAFEYPFLEMRCRRVSTWVERSNAASQRLMLRLGFEREASLSDAGTDGGPVDLWVMRRQSCRWIGAANMAPSPQVQESDDEQESTLCTGA